MEPDAAWRDLNALSLHAHFQMICLVGGEPTLHPKLLEFLLIARESGIADQVVVVTNGSRLKQMPPAFWKSIDVLRYSMYGKRDMDVLPFAEHQCAESGVELQAWEYPEFFKQFKATPDDGVESFKNCAWKSDCFTVHEGAFYLCPQSAFFPSRILGKNSTAGLPLLGMTEEKLNNFLNRSAPFAACKICCAGDKIPAPWKEASVVEWKQESTAGYIPSVEEITRMSE